jgi:vacuolar protein sorting-associated protein 26C
MSHNGISITVEGSVALQLSARSVGLFEAFYSSLKPVELVKLTFEVAPAGKVPAGDTEFPFKFKLQPTATEPLYDTYHGVYINVQYVITCDMPRPMLAKNLKRAVEFVVEAAQERKQDVKPVPYKFKITPTSLQNVRKKSTTSIPDFEFDGHLEATVACLTDPFKGEFTIRKCAVPIKSVELQLVRVETCSYMEGEAREATEIQNLQLADGDPVRNLAIPIHMIFPRLFTCATMNSRTFKLDFEVNLIIVFADNHMVTENFPIKLYR